MKRLVCGLLLIVLLFFVLSVSGQSDTGPTSASQSSFPQYMPNLLPPSPDAYSFTRYGNLPIGLNTGTAQYSIPIYTVSAGSLSMPITINYSSNGVKVDEIATRVGINWSLSAGGAITRIVQDLPDGGAGVQPTYLNVPIVLDTADQRVWDFYDYVRQAQNASPPDYAPDEYSFNVGGFSGKFIKRQNGEFRVLNANGVKIEQNGIGFTIILPNGDKYFFDVYEFAENYTIPASEFLEATPPNVPNAWYLTKILSATRDSILFSYVPVTTVGDSAVTFYNGISQNFSSGTSDWYYINTTDYSLGNRPDNLLVNGYVGYACWTPSPPGVVTAVQKSENYALALQTITFPQGKVHFTYSGREDVPGERKLDSIIVRRTTDDKIITRWALGYTYSYASPGSFDTYLSTTFNFTNVAPELRKRLFLTVVDQLSGSSTDTSRARHRFEYNDINGLPPRLSFSQDRFGYFNGKVNALFFPNDTYFDRFIGNNRFGGDRNFSAHFSKKGILTKIIYPTGGHTSLEYEPNKTALDYAYKFFRDSVDATIDTSTYAGQEVFSDTISSGYNFILRGSCEWASQPIITNNGTGDIELEDQYYLFVEIINVATGNCATGTYCTTTVFPGQSFADTRYGWFVEGGTYKIKVTASKPSLRGRVVLERHWQVADRSDSSGIAGVRVKSISDFAQTGLIAGKKKFLYSAWGDSTGSSGEGVRINVNNGNELSMTRLIGSEIAPFHTTGGQVSGYYCGYNTIHSNSVLTNFVTENNTVLYRVVQELPIVGTNELVNNGGTEYEFYYESKKYPIPLRFTWGDGHVWDPWPYVPPGAPFMNNDFKTGLPKAVRHFSYSSLHGIRNILREQLSYYSLDTPNLIIDTFTISKVARKDADNVPSWPFFANYDLYRYWRYFGFLKQDSIVTRDYTGSGSIYAKQIFYDYHPQNYLPRDIRVQNSQGKQQKLTYKYTPDVLVGQPDYAVHQAMKNANIINGLLEERGFHETSELSKKRLSYTQMVGMYLPDSAFSQTQSGSEYLEAVYQLYDSSGNLLQARGRDGVVTSYVWGYSKAYPVARIVGRTYADALMSSGANMAVISNPATVAALQIELNKFRSLANAFVTTYIYEPLIGLRQETDPNGRNVYYEYDAFNRLSAVRDHDRNIVRKICYTLKGQPSLCGYGSAPAWEVVGATCEQNGQGANTGNVVTTERDMNPASSTYLQTRTTTVANANACPACDTSNCTGLDKKCINGVCETGEKTCTSSVRINQTTWLVTYHYKWSDDSVSPNYEEYGPACFGLIL